MHIAKKFELLLNAYPRPDGRLWSGQQIHEATGGVVTRSYITNLRKGRIQNPGFEKLRAIAQAIGFPPALWFEENPDAEIADKVGPYRGAASVGERASNLIEFLHNEGTGGPWTDAEIARRSFGYLTEEDVKAIRTEQRPDPPVSHIEALAHVLGVHPACFLSKDNTALLDKETTRILRDEATITIARKTLNLSVREKEMVLSIVRQLEEMKEDSNSN